VDILKEPIPIVPTVHYCMGGIPTNEVLTLKDGNPDSLVPVPETAVCYPTESTR
jgi:succinate dehydrogenase/fumarate reductase flavoprotein subunit